MIGASCAASYSGQFITWYRTFAILWRQLALNVYGMKSFEQTDRALAALQRFRHHGTRMQHRSHLLKSLDRQSATGCALVDPCAARCLGTSSAISVDRLIPDSLPPYGPAMTRQDVGGGTVSNAEVSAD
jgi:hypothetical protein